jgi:hypothetical protein
MNRKKEEHATADCVFFPVTTIIEDHFQAGTDLPQSEHGDFPR